MKRYYFRLYQGNEEDGDNVWTEANSKEEAERNIRHDYYDIRKLTFLK